MARLGLGRAPGDYDTPDVLTTRVGEHASFAKRRARIKPCVATWTDVGRLALAVLWVRVALARAV